MQAGLLREVGVGVVDPQRAAAGPVPKPHPGADPLRAEAGAGRWRVGRLLQPESTAVHSLEAAGVEEDGTIFTARAAIVASHSLAAVPRQLRLQEPQPPAPGL